MCIQTFQTAKIPSLHTEHYSLPGAGRYCMSKDIDVLFESLERTQKNIIRRRWKHGGSNIIALFATGARNIKPGTRYLKVLRG
jgi:hypothetical protein